MKFLQSKSTVRALRAALAVIAFAGLSSCGKNNSTTTAPVPGSTVATQPTYHNSDGTYTTYPKDGNSVLVSPGGQVAQGTGACIPLGQPIPFVATNMYMDYANIVGGNVPYTGASGGTIVTGGSIAAGPYSSQNTSQVSISMNLATPIASTAVPYTGYPNQSMYGQTGNYQWNQSTGNYPYGYNGYNQGSNRVSATGVINLSQTVIQAIQAQVYSGRIPLTGTQTGFPSSNYPYGTPATAGTANICVSAVALNIGHFNNILYSGQIYLYLNGTSHGYVTGIY